MQFRDIVAPSLLALSLLAACGESNRPPAVADVEITYARPRLLLGETADFDAVAKSASGEVLRDREVEWTSEHPEIASVTPDGFVTTKAHGFARLFVTSEGLRREHELFVYVNNPSPVLHGISPYIVQATDAPVVLTVYGEQFTPDSRIRVAGSLRQTGFVSSVELVTEVSPSVLERGSPEIRVETPGPGGGVSTARVLLSVQPKPVVTGISPATVAMGGPRLRNVTITGTGFTAGTLLYVNGQVRDINVQQRTTLTFDIFEGELTAPRTIPILVVNPNPGGGVASSELVVTPSPAR